MATKTSSIPIPPSVLAMLRGKWRFDDPPFSFFDLIRTGEFEDRKRQPSFYHFLENLDPDKRGPGTFTFEEARKLHEDGVFGEFSRHAEAGISVQEHAHHALADFLADTYAAWAKYLGRIKEIEKD